MSFIYYYYMRVMEKEAGVGTMFLFLRIGNIRRVKGYLVDFLSEDTMIDHETRFPSIMNKLAKESIVMKPGCPVNFEDDGITAGLICFRNEVTASMANAFLTEMDDSDEPSRFGIIPFVSAGNSATWKALEYLANISYPDNAKPFARIHHIRSWRGLAKKIKREFPLPPAKPPADPENSFPVSIRGSAYYLEQHPDGKVELRHIPNSTEDVENMIRQNRDAFFNLISRMEGGGETL